MLSSCFVGFFFLAGFCFFVCFGGFRGCLGIFVLIFNRLCFLESSFKCTEKLINLGDGESRGQCGTLPFL